MGDRARFRLFADLVEREFPDRSARIADVAAGQGRLQAELFRRGYRRVVSWDVRPHAGRARHYVSGRFDGRAAPRGYDLVVGLHPDGATDHLLVYAAARRVPCVVCPCCVVPAALPYGDGRADFEAWMRHLAGAARAGGLGVTQTRLPMRGRNRVLIGRPSRS